MADFYGAVTTDAGIALVADLLTGEQLVFTKLVTGDGIYADEEIARTKLRKAEELRQPRQEFEFSSMEKITDFCVQLKALISNRELTEGYRINEIGVYAKKPGEEGDGILYSISVAREADYLPHYNGVAAVEIVEEYYITVSDAAEVTIQGRKGAAVLLEDFEAFKKEIKELIDRIIAQKIADLQGQIGDLSQLTTENKGCLVDALNEIATVIRPLVEYSYATNQDIDDIIAEIYVDDVDWITTLEIATDMDIEHIIAGIYEDTMDDGEDAMTDQDIDDIIAGVYVDEPEEGEDGNTVSNLTDTEIDEMIDNALQ